MSPRLLRTLVGIDVRRPASWIALVVGATAGWTLGAAGRQPWLVGVAWAVSVLAVTAAVGDLPMDLCRGAARIPPATLAAVWAALRAAWPLLGAAAACLAHGAGGSDAAAAVAALVAGAATVAAAVVARSARATAADAAAVTLALGGAGALVALAFGLVVGASAGSSERGGWAAGGAAVFGWCVAAVVATIAWRTLDGGDAAVERFTPSAGPFAAVPATGWERLHIEPLPAVGPVQAALERVAMTTTLVAMAGWLILRPDLVSDSGHAVAAPSWPWPLLSAVWYVCLAVPRTTLLDGACGTAPWERICLSAAGSSPVGRRRIRAVTGWRIGRPRFAAVAAFAPAAILGWPALVGGLVSLTSPTHGWPPLAITAGLAAAAVALAALAVAGARMHAACETLFAIALASAAAMALIAARPTERPLWAGGSDAAAARSPVRPDRPASWRPAGSSRGQISC
jgi:hypothetical protein